MAYQREEIAFGSPQEALALLLAQLAVEEEESEAEMYARMKQERARQTEQRRLASNLALWQAHQRLDVVGREAQARGAYGRALFEEQAGRARAAREAKKAHEKRKEEAFKRKAITAASIAAMAFTGVPVPQTATLLGPLWRGGMLAGVERF